MDYSLLVCIENRGKPKVSTFKLFGINSETKGDKKKEEIDEGFNGKVYQI